jgi:hypothetical protein
MKRTSSRRRRLPADQLFRMKGPEAAFAREKLFDEWKPEQLVDNAATVGI